MSDVFDKCTSLEGLQIAKATGLYPYFRPIEASHGAPRSRSRAAASSWSARTTTWASPAIRG